MLRSVKKSRLTKLSSNILKRSCNTPNPKPEETKLRFRIWADCWSYYKHRAIFVNAVFGIVAVSGIGYYLKKSKRSLDSILPSTTPPEDIILNAFEIGKGFDTNKNEDESAFVNRTLLNQRLKMVLCPEKSKQYVVIVGENGCGKSTAVRKVLSSLPEPRGVVYFDCPPDPKEFSTQLLELLEYRSSLNVSEGVRRYLEKTTKEEKDVDVNTEPLSSFSLFGKYLVTAAATLKTSTIAQWC